MAEFLRLVKSGRTRFSKTKWRSEWKVDGRTSIGDFWEERDADWDDEWEEERGAHAPSQVVVGALADNSSWAGEAALLQIRLPDLLSGGVV